MGVVVFTGSASAEQWDMRLSSDGGDVSWVGAGTLPTDVLRYVGSLSLDSVAGGFAGARGLGSVNLLAGVPTAYLTTTVELGMTGDEFRLRFQAPTPPEPVVGYDVTPAFRTRWMTGDMTAAIVGDSISSPTYTTGQGSLTHGLARAAGSRLVGIQWPIQEVTDSYNHPTRLANYLQFYTRYPSGNWWLNDPFGRPGEQTTYAGEIAFMPMFGRQMGFSSTPVSGQELVAYPVRAPLNADGDDWWINQDDLRFAWLWFNGQSVPDAEFTIETRSDRDDHQGWSIEQSLPWNPSAGSAGLNIEVLDLSATGGGAVRVEARLLAPEGAQPFIGTDIVYPLPMVYLAETAGIRLWNLAISGWGYREHSRTNPSVFPDESPGQYYTDAALDQFYDAAAETGCPVNTLVFTLGANDTWAGMQTPTILTANAARKTIERHARAARRHVAAEDLQVLIVAPYAVPNSTPSTQWSNANRELWTIAVRGTGDVTGPGAGVPAEQISYISHYTMMGELEIDNYDPVWEQAGGGVHPSPIGADGLGELLRIAIEDTNAPGVEPASAQFDLVVSVGASGEPSVSLEQITFGEAVPVSGPPAESLASMSMSLGLVLNGVLAPTTDLTGDGLIDAADLAVLLAQWGACSHCSADLNIDSKVDSADLAALLARWGETS